jgi:hypothetical protein
VILAPSLRYCNNQFQAFATRYTANNESARNLSGGIRRIPESTSGQLQTAPTSANYTEIAKIAWSSPGASSAGRTAALSAPARVDILAEHQSRSYVNAPRIRMIGKDICEARVIATLCV